MMKTVINTYSAILFLSIVGTVVFGSCVKVREIEPAAGWDRTAVTFRIHVPAGGQPATRSLEYADEYAVETVDVLVFREGKYVYTAAGTVTSAPTAPDNNSNAVMTFRASLRVDPDPCELMIVANARGIIAGAYPGGSGIPADTPRETVEKALLMLLPAGGWVYEPTRADYRPMPMWGYMKNQTIDEAYDDVAHNINLARMVAKVDVRLAASLVDASNPDDSPFQLRSVRVYNYATKGRLIPYTDGPYDWSTANSGNFSGYQIPSLPPFATSYYDDIQSAGANQYIDYAVDFTATNPYRYLTGQIYLFEAPRGVLPAPGDNSYLTNPCVVIGGIYRGDAAESYYRIDFARKDEQNNLVYLPILRNNSYTINVTGISGSGYSTQAEAYGNVPVNIETSILVWDENEIVDDNDNRFAISSRGISLPFIKNRTERLDVESTVVYTIQWLDGEGNPVGTATSALNTTISNDRFDVRIVRDPSDPQQAAHLSFRTRVDNYNGELATETLLVTAGASTLRIAVSQENTAVYSNRSFKLFSPHDANSYSGHLGDAVLPSTASTSGRGMRSLLDTWFRPDGTVKISGFNYLGFDAAANTMSATASGTYAATYARIAQTINQQDVIYLPLVTTEANGGISDDLADVVLAWLAADSRRVLILGTDSRYTNVKLINKIPAADGAGSGSITAGAAMWTWSRIGDASSGTGDNRYLRAADSPGSEPFFNGPFGAVPPDAGFHREDGYAGYNNNPEIFSANVVPLITGDKAGYTEAMIMGVNPGRRIVYHGDASLFNYGMTWNTTTYESTITTAQDKLMGNLWAWIVTQLIYGDDIHGGDFAP